MSRKANTAIKNALTDNYAGYFPASSLLKIYTGAQPSTGDTAVTGTLLATITLPATPFAASSSGTAAKSGTWSATASASGTAGYYRLISQDTTKSIDGAITVTSGGGELELDNTSINSGQTITISAFSLTSLSGN